MTTDHADQAPNLMTVLELLRDEGPAVAKEAGIPAGWCLTAAGMTKLVLAQFGFHNAQAFAVDVAIRASSGALTPPHLWPASERWLEVRGTGQVDARGWDGHAVAYIPGRVADGQPWLVDLSAGQFSGPDRRHRITPLVAAVSGGFVLGEVEGVLRSPIAINMRRRPDLDRFVSEALADSQSGLQVLAQRTCARIALRLERATSKVRGSHPLIRRATSADEVNRDALVERATGSGTGRLGAFGDVELVRQLSGPVGASSRCFRG